MNKTGYQVAIIVSAVIMVAGIVMTALTGLASVSENSYLSSINVSGVVYGVILGVGFVALVTLLQLYLEDFPRK